MNRNQACLTVILAWVSIGCTCADLSGPDRPPEVSTSIARLGNEQSLSVQFEASPSDPDGGPVQVMWSFPDGTTSSSLLILHTFPRPDTFPVVLNLLDDEGMSATRTLHVTVPVQRTEPVETPVERHVPNEGDEHVPVGTDIQYATNPPASGPHYAQPGLAPAQAGMYDEALLDEIWVHNLEHGYIVILYDCDGDCDEAFLDQLQVVFDATPPSAFGNRKMVITRYPGLQPAFMAVAWDVQLDFDSLDAPGMLAFYERHVDNGPEDLP
jgi:hypothetical protein